MYKPYNCTRGLHKFIMKPGEINTTLYTLGYPYAEHCKYCFTERIIKPGKVCEAVLWIGGAIVISIPIIYAVITIGAYIALEWPL